MECFVCKVLVEDDPKANYFDMYTIFKHLKVEFSDDERDDFYMCEKCQTLSERLISSLDGITISQNKMKGELENFKRITNVTNPEEWKERIIREKERHIEYCDREARKKSRKLAKRANRELKRNGVDLTSEGMQPKLILWKLDADLAKHDHERIRKEVMKSKRDTTAFICGLCKPKRSPNLFTCKQELERHKFSEHIEEIFKEIKPENWDSRQFKEHLIEFINNKIDLPISPNRVRKKYFCEYCYTKHELDDRDELYFHLVEVHRWDFTKYLKKCVDKKTQEIEEKRLQYIKNPAEVPFSWLVIKPFTAFKYFDPANYPLAWWQTDDCEEIDENEINSDHSEIEREIRVTKLKAKSKMIKTKIFKSKNKSKKHARSKKSKVTRTAQKLTVKRDFKPKSSRKTASKNNLCLAPMSTENITIEFLSEDTECDADQGPPNLGIKEEISDTLFEETSIFPAFTNPSKVEQDKD